MSKKLLIIIMSVVIGLVILGGGVFVYLTSRNTEAGATTVLETIKRLNPFGASDPLGIRDVLNSTPFENTASTTTEGEFDIISSQALFKLSDERSSGVAFADVLVPKMVEVRKKITIDDPLVASSSKPRKIQVMATTTETVYATTSRIRYVEQGSGHIYEYDYASSTTRKLTNTTIPKTQEAYFLDNGSKVLLRYLDNTNRVIENYLANIPTSSVADKLSGRFLPNNITALSISPSTGEFFYVAKTDSGSIGNIYNVKSGTEKRVFSSAFSEWLPDWVSAGVFLTTKPASSVSGFTYLQSITKNTFSRVTGNKLGLTTLANPAGTKVLLGEGTALSILTVSSGEVAPIYEVFTLPEKCLWETDTSLLCFGSDVLSLEAQPESWYQGKTRFDDSLFLISTDSLFVNKVATMPELYTKSVFIDAIRPSLSRDGQGLVFLNKADMTPWFVDLKKVFSFLELEGLEQ